MNSCKKIRMRIVTDYLDAELAPVERKRIDAHLAECPDCRRYSDQAQAMLSEVFPLREPQPVPAGIWESVRDRLPPEGTVRARWGDAFFFPVFRWAPAFVILLILIAVGLPRITQRVNEGGGGEEIADGTVFLATIAGVPDSGDDLPVTPIEEYFL